MESAPKPLNHTTTSPKKDLENNVMNYLELINKILESLHMLLSCNMILSRKMRKLLKEIKRIRMNMIWKI
jgi:hypothetical protein